MPWQVTAPAMLPLPPSAPVVATVVAVASSEPLTVSFPAETVVAPV
jgi:hypothetical protein